MISYFGLQESKVFLNTWKTKPRLRNTAGKFTLEFLVIQMYQLFINILFFDNCFGVFYTKFCVPTDGHQWGRILIAQI